MSYDLQMHKFTRHLTAMAYPVEALIAAAIQRSGIDHTERLAKTFPEIYEPLTERAENKYGLTNKEAHQLSDEEAKKLNADAIMSVVAHLQESRQRITGASN